MIPYRLSNKAIFDLQSIYQDALHSQNKNYANSCLIALDEKLQELSEHPDLGVDISDIRPGYRRLLHQNTAIYYQVTDKAILIVRLMHRRIKASIFLI